MKSFILNITARMKARRSKRNIDDGCIEITAPLLRIFRGVVRNYLSDDAISNRMKAPPDSSIEVRYRIVLYQAANQNLSNISSRDALLSLLIAFSLTLNNNTDKFHLLISTISSKRPYKLRKSPDSLVLNTTRRTSNGAAVKAREAVG